MDDKQYLLNQLDGAQVEALRNQLKTSVSELDVYGGLCYCHGAAAHTSHTDCDDHQSHCDTDGWV